MELCRKNGFHYILTHKGSRQKVLEESYQLYIESGYGEKVDKIGAEKGKGIYVNHVEESVGRKNIANIFEYSYTEIKGKSGIKTTKFQWITDIELTSKNMEEMIETARGRWKIENEGFNNQKNGIYEIEHINSHNTNGMKNHYLLAQIADINMQLYLAWNPMRKAIKLSIKNIISIN